MELPPRAVQGYPEPLSHARFQRCRELSRSQMCNSTSPKATNASTNRWNAATSPRQMKRVAASTGHIPGAKGWAWPAPAALALGRAAQLKGAPNTTNTAGPKTTRADPGLAGGRSCRPMQGLCPGWAAPHGNLQGVCDPPPASFSPGATVPLHLQADRRRLSTEKAICTPPIRGPTPRMVAPPCVLHIHA